RLIARAIILSLFGKNILVRNASPQRRGVFIAVDCYNCSNVLLKYPLAAKKSLPKTGRRNLLLGFAVMHFSFW
ncbi:MAG: hypothetical protein IIW27_04710, partial [Clostridia bacterium]|nr:hypothetical protein [Clostridia bacterium]